MGVRGSGGEGGQGIEVSLAGEKSAASTKGLEYRCQTILGVATTESLLAFDGLRVCVLVLNQCGSSRGGTLVLDLRAPIQSIGVARQSRRQIAEGIIGVRTVSLLGQSHFSRAVQAIEPFLGRYGGGPNVAGRGLGILKDKMFVALDVSMSGAIR